MYNKECTRCHIYRNFEAIQWSISVRNNGYNQEFITLSMLIWWILGYNHHSDDNLTIGSSRWFDKYDTVFRITSTRLIMYVIWSLWQMTCLTWFKAWKMNSKNLKWILVLVIVIIMSLLIESRSSIVERK